MGWESRAAARCEAMDARIEARCASARASVQGNDHAASHGLLGRMQGARAVKSGRSRGGNAGSNAFRAMQSSHSGGADYSDGSGCVMNPSNEVAV